jgi:hypothetical protein
MNDEKTYAYNRHKLILSRLIFVLKLKRERERERERKCDYGFPLFLPLFSL